MSEQTSAAQSAPAGAVPEGYRWYLVPKEDTDAFNAACSAANDAYLGGVGPCGVFIAGYRAMLAAAPATPAAQGAVPDVSAMARVLSDRSADACNIDRDDNWAMYGQEYIEDVQAMLAASTGQEVEK